MVRLTWSELPEDLLRMVMKNLPLFIDLVRFSGVCSQWRSAAKSVPLPVILAVPDRPGFNYKSITLSKKQKKNNNYNYKSIVNLLYVNQHLVHCIGDWYRDDYYCCVGSSKGAVIVVDRGTMSVPVVINPFTHQTYRFPKLQQMPSDGTCIKKAILLSVRNSLVLVVIYGGKYDRSLAYCSLSDATWKQMSCGEFRDIVSSKDGSKVYMLSVRGTVASWNFLSPLTKPFSVVFDYVPPKFSMPPHVDNVYDDRIPLWRYKKYDYLAVGPGDNEFFLVRRIEVPDSDREFRFAVYKANYSSSTWEVVDHKKGSFSGAAVFVGRNETMVFYPASAEEFPARGCIYFTNEDRTNVFTEKYRHDVGVYSLEKDTIVAGLWDFFDDCGHICFPFWIMPNLL